MSDFSKDFEAIDDEDEEDGEGFSPFDESVWALAHGRGIILGPDAITMGILNVTPDSFSDGGRHEAVDMAVAHAEAMIEAGADIIDIGGESTRPDATPVDADTEQSRIKPVIEELSGRESMLLSVDTYRASTAEMAVSSGVHIINDVGGCQIDSDIARVAADTGAGLVVMHSSRDREVNPDPIEDQIEFFQKSLDICHDAGVEAEQIVLDPGFGFGKDGPGNIVLLQVLPVLHGLGFPLLIGTSRKRFLKSITGKEAAGLGAATAATSVIARMQGGAVFRVHDVAENVDALAVADAVIAAPRSGLDS
ncbi:MAG: dihydropteroate synthase [Ahrensia sp.]|nr:dihydropteroate synthase [Ahrensia sp.]